MSNSQTFLSDTHGSIVLKTADQEFVCTYLQLNINMNEIPTATVTIGSGVYLKDNTKQQSVEALLAEVLKRRSKAYLDMIDCSICEKEGNKETVIFKGCIVTGTTIYQAGTRTIRAIRFMCMNSICKLLARPLSEYVQVDGTILINYIGTKATLDPVQALNTADTFRQGRVTVDYVIQENSATLRDAKIHERVSTIVDTIVKAGSYCDQVQKVKPNSQHILDFITCDYVLNTEVCSDECKDTYNKDLCERMFAMLFKGSILDSIKAIMTSEDFMMQLTPEFGGDFKVRLEPSSAWVKQDSIKLTEAHINGIQSSYNPLACINTPEAFIVNFAPAVSMLHNENPTDYLGANGVFTTNQEIQQALEKAYQTPDKDSLGEISNKLYRAKMYNAPKWFLPSFIGKSATGESSNGSSDHRRHESSTDGPDTQVPKIDIGKARELGNKLAQGIFTLVYGSHDTAVLNILPSLRFGRNSNIKLEENLGKPIDIEFTELDKAMNIRGVLTGVSYTYDADQISRVAYGITLTRVRPLDANEVSVECPLYKKA